ncbi:thioredoxin domain-containing protein [Pontixanthobacter aestiaquae]|uniref:Thioredoxin domain-containing protein n=1 Tax=Pontixanthobacter aestiaquae TaxID=1509367 RepID=A0A844Z9Q6_9SPHN|nr:thioredoxin domain-containing protein [Pontixanthobacter aestiaquae]MDN3644947.1 thioredoxin domain-containing protein [Pontixanthobacter aestiaquae]MXO84052.1 thioredoxin domain-containing protein [Pontixanthobacter aestiaquae]
MKLKKFFRAGAVITAALLTTAATSNWAATVSDNGRGKVIGNPDAKVTLTEFVSYTCPHCATFTLQGEAPLQLAYIGTGKLMLDVRSVIRNPVDTTVTMLVQCGASDKFFRNHAYFMTSQRTWLPIVRRPTEGQRQRWNAPDGATARKAIAEDAGFYAMMETRGYSRTELDTCLNDEARAEQLETNTVADFAEFGITGTPSFAINGKTLPNVHDWRTLEPKLNANFDTF